MAYNNFSMKQLIERHKHDKGTTFSNDPIKKQQFNKDNWRLFIAYYRWYPDKLATDYFGLIIYPWQRIVLRAIFRSSNVDLNCSRRIGKTEISNIAAFLFCVLFPGVECLIVAPSEAQAQISISNKFKSGLMRNENCAREIKNITKTEVEFKNGSVISAKGVGADGSGSNLLGNGKQFILIDEARLIDLPTVMTAINPMLATPRRNWGEANEKIGNLKYENPKLILASSSWYREHTYYTDYYKMFFDEMKKNNKNYYAFSFNYKWAKKCLNYDKVLEDKRKMTKEDFEREYGAKMLRANATSYFNAVSIKEARILTKCEIRQPMKSKARYIIAHDVATAENGDNAITYVIKLVPRIDGLFEKQIVYLRSYNGAGIDIQAEFIKYLYWECFPNVEKIIYDERSAGQRDYAILFNTIHKRWNRNAYSY